MILHHVAQCPGGIVEAGPAFDGESLVPNYLHSLDVLRVPQRFKDPVRKAKSENILHRLFTQEVVHAKDRLFGKALVQ